MKSIPVFHEYNSYREKGKNAPMFCSFGNNVFESEDGALPRERSVPNRGKIVYRIKSSSGGLIMFPFHGWGAFSLEQYYENGYIEFDVCGAEGGEDFLIGLRSDTRGRVLTHSVPLSALGIKVSKTWQSVKVPVKNIVGSTVDGFDIKSINLVTLNTSKAQTFYLSEMYISSPDNEIQHPVIKVNQTGYKPDRAKFALVSCFPGTINLSVDTEFSVIDKNGNASYSGKLEAVKRGVDETSGEIVFKADFSSLSEPGEYFIRITDPAVEDSFAFIIDGGVYDDLFIDVQRYFYFQRQGLELEERYAGVFARKNLHPRDSEVNKLSRRASGDPVYDVSQGWYDAGDYGKYIPPAASTVSDLLFAYEFFPSLFADNQLNIPESGNGSPDLLDEIKWELDMMLKFEDGNSGGFWEVANYMNMGGSVERIFIIDTNGEGGEGSTISTAATASSAAVFAHAYIIYKNIPRHSAFAERNLAAAIRAFDYLEAHPGNTWVNGANRSYYHSKDETGIMRFWAAAALYRATGNAKYRDYVLDKYQSFNYNRQFNGWQVYSTFPLGTGFLHYALTPNPDANVLRFLDSKFTGFEKVQMGYYNEKAWPVMLVDWAYFWGSNIAVCRTPVELFMFNKVLGHDTTHSVQVIRDTVHYLLGINPLSFSFVSGYGTHCVKNIFSTIYSNDGIDEIPPGYMAGGSNGYDSGFMSNWPSKCYVDSDKEWTTNEHAIYWNAALVLLLSAERGTSEVKTDSKFSAAP